LPSADRHLPNEKQGKPPVQTEHTEHYRVAIANCRLKIGGGKLLKFKKQIFAQN
jgi:hypothetical protein